MDRAHDEPSHQAAVDAWLARSIDQRSSVEIIRLFQVALEAVWHRAVTTLGTVTLTAIGERVLHKATAKYAFLGAVNARPNGDTRWRETLHERLASVPRAELVEGLRYGLVELLTVIGALTAEILTAELHVALAEVSAPMSSEHDSPTRLSLVGVKVKQ